MMKRHINSEQAYRMIAHKRGPSYKKHGVETHASCVTRHFLKPGKEILKGTRASAHSPFLRTVCHHSRFEIRVFFYVVRMTTFLAHKFFCISGSLTFSFLVWNSKSIFFWFSERGHTSLAPSGSFVYF